MKQMVETLKVEEGKVAICNTPFIFTFTKSIYYMQKELEKVLGEKWKKIMYDCGKNDADMLMSGYFSMFYGEKEAKELMFSRKLDVPSRVKFVGFCNDQFNKAGMGRAELAENDIMKPVVVEKLYFSPIALAYLEHEKSTEPVCYYFAGFFSGGASTACPGLEAVETKCMAKGDPYCEFVVTFPKKK